jgi:hypothetical protein
VGKIIGASGTHPKPTTLCLLPNSFSGQNAPFLLTYTEACFARFNMNILSALNNREIATAIWLTVIFLGAMFISGVRHSFSDLLNALFNKKIVGPIIVMLVYIFLVIMIFKKVGFWDMSATKDTILWTLGTAFVSYFSLNKVAQDDNFFKNLILENIKFIFILEFVINLYSFNLAVELIVIPMVSFIVVLNAYAVSKPECRQVKKILNLLLGVFGLFLLVMTFREIVLDFQKFATLKNLRDFFLPPLLSIALLPFVYVMALVMQYEMFFVRINIANKNSVIAKKVKRKIFAACNINLSKLIKVSKSAGYPKVKGEADVLEWLKIARQ